ncbi:MAG: DUF539 domain-containing protein [Pseudomonadota bacterium]
MTLYLVAFAVVLLSFLGLAIGVLLGREPIKGSCGGLGSSCGACKRECPRKQAAEEN